MLNSSLQVGGAFGLVVVTAAIMPGAALSMLRPGLVIIFLFGVMAPLTFLTGVMRVSDRR